MTDLLRAQGFSAYNVAGGTRAWELSGRPLVAGRTPHPVGQGAHRPQILTVETPTLGDRSYLVHDGQVAFVVDPQRDIDRVFELLERHSLRLTHVFETHLHNDYVTGGLALAERTGAAYLVNADDAVAFERTPVRDGDVVAVGARMRVQALATPGHTFTHLSFVLRDGEPGEQLAVFSGGSLLYGATGRPDLLGPEHTHQLVRLQHASAHRLAAELPDDAGVFPTHGFGSFCSATQSEATESTIGQERRSNPVLTQDEETYVRELLDGLGAFPAYYAHMGPANAAGPSAPDLSPPGQADPAELRRRIEAGEWVVDLRNRTVFAAGHVPGTLNFGLDGAFATYVGWLIDWGTPLTLLGETAEDVATAQRELVRIGIDRPAAAATGGPEQWTDAPLTGFPTATFADLAQVRHHRPVTILDVRRADEYAAARIDGAVNIPIHELTRRLDEVPAGELWIHCAGGYRASVAASVLDAAGHRLVAVDDSFDNARLVNLHLIGPEA
ncbi:MBL fold metallo-hydrolase [Nocardioides mesophilus]|uniref:MBL fold metallo-hydrolase n=2 Tax=Nocardioides mesophilus TaxID=433659 RepID=A0A7G9RH33_9ACTN|nr:MBL fold metallo-hydrolase [Nocardioides mesophilus]